MACVAALMIRGVTAWNKARVLAIGIVQLDRVSLSRAALVLQGYEETTGMRLLGSLIHSG
jgi:hypothetical protein